MLNPPKRKTEIPKVDKSMKTDEKSQQHDKILSAKGNREADKASTAEEDIEEEVSFLRHEDGDITKFSLLYLSASLTVKCLGFYCTIKLNYSLTK